MFCYWEDHKKDIKKLKIYIMFGYGFVDDGNVARKV